MPPATKYTRMAGALLLVTGCSEIVSDFTFYDADAGPTDAAAPDSGSIDAGTDASIGDAGSDGSTPDAGPCPGCDLLCIEGECVDGIVDLRAGFGHTCALRASGTVVCWGENTFGQIGDGTQTDRPTPTTVPIPPATVVDTSLDPHTCAAEEDGGVLCWGENDRGALGIGSTDPSFLLDPTPVVGVSDARDVAAGAWHGCAVRRSGAVVCWGDGSLGQLGNGGSDNRYTATAVAASLDAQRISAGGSHTCSLEEGGDIYCWGQNIRGAVGHSSELQVLTPFAVPGISDAIDVTAGSAHTCVLRPLGSGVECWGDNQNEQLGIDSSTELRVAPELVAGTEMAVDVDAGANHTCAVLDDGSVVCWGTNAFGQLGAEPSSPAAEPVPGLPPAVAVAAGSAHTCAALASGGVMCWGRNEEGQLGNGMTSSMQTAPITVVGLP